MVIRVLFVALAAVFSQASAQCCGQLNSNQCQNNQIISPCQLLQELAPCNQQREIITVQPQYQCNQQLLPPCQQRELAPCNQQREIITVQPQYQCNQQLLPPCQNQQPVYATTIIDNSVSNALANALQLLIVSDLIESTLNARNGDCVVETDLCGQCLSPVEAYPVVQELVSSCGCGSYPVVQEVVQSYAYPEVIQSYAPVQYAPPLAAEVVFPTSIPAQLTCNFGYVPSVQPVVQVVGVEPLSSYPSCGCGCSCGAPQYYY